MVSVRLTQEGNPSEQRGKDPVREAKALDVLQNEVPIDANTPDLIRRGE